MQGVLSHAEAPWKGLTFFHVLKLIARPALPAMCPFIIMCHILVTGADSRASHHEINLSVLCFIDPLL